MHVFGRTSVIKFSLIDTMHKIQFAMQKVGNHFKTGNMSVGFILLKLEKRGRGPFSLPKHHRRLPLRHRGAEPLLASSRGVLLQTLRAHPGRLAHGVRVSTASFSQVRMFLTAAVRDNTTDLRDRWVQSANSKSFQLLSYNRFLPHLSCFIGRAQQCLRRSDICLLQNSDFCQQSTQCVVVYSGNIYVSVSFMWIKKYLD